MDIDDIKNLLDVELNNLEIVRNNLLEIRNKIGAVILPTPAGSMCISCGNKGILNGKCPLYCKHQTIPNLIGESDCYIQQSN